MAEIIHGDHVYVNLDEVIETVYQCRRDVADEEWEKRWLEPLENLPRIEAGVDAISREWLLEEYQKGKEKISESECFAELMWLVKHAPSVIPKPKEGEWIPCSERTPPKKGHYLCSFTKPNRIDHIYIDLAYWTGAAWHGYLSNRINAWMPLPEPWKGASND